MTSTKKQVRETEKYLKAMTSDKAEQIAIISKAQSLTLDNEHNITVLAIVKNRIIHS
jgi:hypothetical protein